MEKSMPIYTEKNNCQDCYKCVKECPVKAIKIEDASASVIPELCVYCGKCTQVCPANAKKVREDFHLVKQDLNNGQRIIVSLAPSYLSEYANEDVSQVIAAFHEAGFYGVSETAIGAEKVSLDTKRWLDDKEGGVYISSCCPSVVMLIRKYYPQYSDLIAPFYSPMIAHSKFLKEIYPDTKVMFVGPCVAKKTESDKYRDLIDYAITFEELSLLLEEKGIYFEFMKPTDKDVFIPYSARKGNLYPVDGGMITTMINSIDTTEARINHNTGNVSSRYMTFSGVKNIIEIVEDLDTLKKEGKTFLELMMCDSGCVKGPCSTKIKSSAIKRVEVLRSINTSDYCDEKKIIESLNKLDISTDYDYISQIEEKEYTQQQIYDALRMVNKRSEADELNCGGCGYDNCIEFAKALIEGKAENEMCISYMRKMAQDKTNILLSKMPSGIVIVNDKMKVVDSNKKFADILGQEVQLIFDANPGLSGADITKLVDFHKLFSSVLISGVDIIEQDIRDAKNNYYSLSIFSIQKHSLVCGIIQNLRSPEVRKDLVLNRTREVILENMKVVQQIAFLLGENASYTESMLNSILESHSDEEKQSDIINFDI